MIKRNKSEKDKYCIISLTHMCNLTVKLMEPHSKPWFPGSSREENGEKLVKGSRGVQPFGVSGPHWKKNCYLGPHIKYTSTNEN